MSARASRGSRAVVFLVDHLLNHLMYSLLLLGVKDGAFHGVLHIELLRESDVEGVNADQEDEGEGEARRDGCGLKRGQASADQENGSNNTFHDRPKNALLCRRV